MKHVADLKAFLEERIAELKEEIEAFQEELEIYEHALENIDAILTQESFKSAADLLKKPGKAETISSIKEESKRKEKMKKEEYQIKSKMGKLLGSISIFGNTISIVPEKDMAFPVSAAPFRSFFEGKILDRMQNEDEIDIEAGKLAESDKLLVNILKDEEENIKNIIIQNYRSYDRKMDIINTITWTFRTIYDEQMGER
ncbi:MAG: hypothetical protein ACTSRS_16285 [Candidatus Helarchaeota archaeon]